MTPQAVAQAPAVYSSSMRFLNARFCWLEGARIEGNGTGAKRVNRCVEINTGGIGGSGWI
ncbi:MAG: hypothetical protein CBC67_04040 [Gammaproteobacteria bacterium TMED107]|nr:hypothetical protein [Gammaproteobacteria bacterium]OUX75685.1 MAG: hypothetical protein CBC67_04040 [Gammaproteobacteria bacterium TMED107]